MWHVCGTRPGRVRLRRYASERGVRGAALFLAWLVVRGRAGAGSAGSLSASASLAWLGCSASRRISARAVSRSLSARSARMRSASRVSSTALICALVAAVSWSSARWWSARMRAVSSAAEAWACWARVMASTSTWRALAASCPACSARASASATWRAASLRVALMSRSASSRACRISAAARTPRSGGLTWADGEGMSSPLPQSPDNQDQVATSILKPEVPRCIGRESSACPNRHKGMTCKPAWIDMRMSVPTRSVMTFPLGPAERSSCTHEQLPSEAPRPR